MGRNGGSRTRAFALAASLVTGLVVGVPAAPSAAQSLAPGFAKAFSPDTIGPGSATTLTFTIDHAGATPVTELAFTDDLPPEIRIADPANVVNGCLGTVSAPAGGGTIALSDGAVGAAATCTIAVDVTSSTIGTHTNTSSSLTSTAGSSGSATADLTVTGGLPGLTKSFDASLVPLGHRSTLTITVDNTLNVGNVSSVAFTDTLPAGMVVADPNGASTDCRPAALPVGVVDVLTAVPGTNQISLAAFGSSPSNVVVAAGASCTVVVDVVASAIGALGNSTGPVQVGVNSSFSEDAGKANATLDVTRSAVHLVKEFTDDPVLPETNAALRFTITNFDRNFTATDVAFTDDLDAALAGLAAVAPLPADPCGAGSSLAGTGVLTLSGGVLAPGATCTFDVAVAVPAGGASRSTNTTDPVTATVGGSPATGNVASDDLFVVVAPVLTKEFTDDPQGAGGSVTLQFTIVNPDPDNEMTDIAFTDVFDVFLPTASEVAGTPVPPAPGTLTVNNVCGAGSELLYEPLIVNNPATLTLAAGALAAGGSCTFDVVLDVASGAASGAHPNVTSPIQATVGGTTVAGPAASDTFTVVGAPPVRKAFVDDPVAPGDTVTLEITVVNGGASEADFDSLGPVADITLTDDLTFVAGLTAVAPLPTDPCGTGSTLTASGGGTLLTLQDGNLAEDESCTFSVTLQTSATTPVGIFTNTIDTVSATASGVPVTGPGASDDLLVTDVTVTKEFTDDPVVAGDTVTLDFTVDNQGTLDATSIQFTDDLDDTLSGLALGSILSDNCGGTLVGSAGNTFLTYFDGSVPAGASCTISVQLLVPAGAAADTYPNATSFISMALGETPLTLPPATDDLVVADAPTVDLQKEFIDDPVVPGGTVTMRLTMSNPSAIGITGIGFTDDLAAALSGLSATGLPLNACGGTLAGSAGNTLLTFGGGALAGGEVCSFDVTLTVPAGATPATYTNTTSAVAADGEVTGAAASDDLVVSEPDPQALRADLSITKDDDVDPVVAGGAITYTIEVTNAGPDTATNVVVDDDLPGDDDDPLAFLMGTIGCLNDPFTLTCELGDLAPGGSALFTITVLVAENATGTLINTATVTSDVADSDPSNNTATEDTLVAEAADLSITKSDSPDPVVAGGQLTYTITVANAGPATALDVFVDDTLPAGVSNPSTSGCAEDPSGAAGCTLGSIAPGDTSSFTVTVDVDPSTLGTITNSASVSATNPDPDVSNNTVSEDTTVVAEADLSITKSDDVDPVIAGDQLTYTIDVANAGPSDAANVVVTDTLPAGVANPVTAGCAEDPGGVPTCTLGAIPAGGSASFTVTVTVDTATAGTITNEATVSSDASDPDPGDNATSEDTFVRNGADLSIEKVDDVDPIEAHSHERLVYTITVTNLGPFLAEDVVVTDTLPAGIQFKETVGCAEDKTGVPTCSLGDLAAGASVSYTVEVKMKTQTPLGTMTNVAEVTAATLDQDGSNNVATEDTLVCKKMTDFQECGEVEVISPFGTPKAATPATASTPVAASAAPAATVAPAATAAPAATGGPVFRADTLPATGTDATSPITSAALAMLAAGLALLAVGRTRRRHPVRT